MKIFKFARVVLTLALLGLVFASGIVWHYSRPARSQHLGEEKIFVVNKGEGSGEIGIRLQKEGLIRHRYAFWAVVGLHHLSGKLQAGSFRLSPNMSLKEIGQTLTKGRLDQWVTIIEGVRQEEIAWQLGREMGIDIQEFLSASQDQEGFLFPDTYLFPQGAGARKVVSIMRDNFEKKTKDLWPQAEKNKLSREQVLILASLVEREAKKDQDRALVAGILVKRWQSDWPLQIDAAVQYAKASQNCPVEKECRWWPVVTKDDLKIISPYNTYENKDLPPAPICNPSLSSIEAVVNYQLSSYWFYLSDRRSQIHFSQTLEEHQANIRKYL
ncbi:endolytic transglycosylase MltG [Candidatus Shapirobacteria bacterium]|nr:endolytic transglycosylase MltG [Candidatus Shapirobacteria bacterium]